MASELEMAFRSFESKMYDISLGHKMCVSITQLARLSDRTFDASRIDSKFVTILRSSEFASFRVFVGPANLKPVSQRSISKKIPL